MGDARTLVGCEVLAYRDGPPQFTPVTSQRITTRGMSRERTAWTPSTTGSKKKAKTMLAATLLVAFEHT
jgi:hypothetical protein